METYHVHSKSVKFPHYRFKASPTKIPAGFFNRHKLILKLIQEDTVPRITKPILTGSEWEESCYSILMTTTYLQ